MGMADNLRVWKKKIENLSQELRQYINDFYVYNEEKLTDTEDDFLQDLQSDSYGNNWFKLIFNLKAGF